MTETPNTPLPYARDLRDETRVPRGIFPPRIPTVVNRPVLAYSLALILVALATAAQYGLQEMFQPNSSGPFVMYYIAVMIAAWYAGLGPGLLTVALSGLLGKFLYVPQRFSFYVDVEREDFLAICLFLALGMFFNVVCELARRAQADARLSAVDAERQKELVLIESGQRRRAIAELRDSEARLHDLYDNAPDMMLSISSQTGDVVECNHTLVRELGYSKGQILGRSVYHLYHPDCVPAARESFRVFLDKGEVHNVPLMLRRRDGSTIDVSMSATAVRDRSGRIVRSRSVWRDITDRRRAEDTARALRAELMKQQAEERDRIERELESTRDQLVRQTRLAAIGQVSASIAHDLRNPLGVIQNATFLLKSSLDLGEPIEREVVGMIEEEVRTSDRIISNLMEMTRAKDPRKTEVDLGPAAEETFSRSSAPPGVVFRQDLSPHPFVIWADAGQMRQVLDNLLRNAVEAIEDGRGTVELHARRADGFDEIEVRDSGRGVPLEMRERLFEPLVTTKAKGTGLGLMICRQIVTKHGGTIELTGSDEHGTTFLIRIPCLSDTQPLMEESIADEKRLASAHR